MVRESNNFTHSYSGYINYGCRCDVCREANRVHIRDRRERAKARRLAAEADGRVYVVEGIKHGGSSYGNHGCRCPVCREGHRLNGAYYRSRVR